jgi:flavin reductase (DIM6/NTAB) family NADH-FMN oxidoreductase RutF
VKNEGIGRGLAMIPSGVFVLAARQGERTSAILASFVQQSGFQPPSVVVAVGRDRPVRQMIEDSGLFALSVMSTDSKASLKRFWKGVPEGADPFEGLATRTSEGGMPILEDAVAWLECSLRHTIDLGDHFLCVGEVTGGGRLSEGSEPMVRIRKDGFEY